jgi:hypothetical protein
MEGSVQTDGHDAGERDEKLLPAFLPEATGRLLIGGSRK